LARFPPALRPHDARHRVSKSALIREKPTSNPSFILIENVHERQDGTTVLGENVSSGQDDFASTFRAVREFIEKKR